jgi:hypothetical protein
MDWARILACVTGMVNRELLARNEYLAAENRILKAQLKGRLKLSDAERAVLGETGHRLGRTALAEVATMAGPDTILAWYRKLVARKFDGSKARRGPGRPRITREVEQLIVRMAKENRDWGYDRIAGALANLGHEVCDQTVGNVLHRHGLPPAPERKRTSTWPEFIRIHLALLAGTDFFTAEVFTLRGLVTWDAIGSSALMEKADRIYETPSSIDRSGAGRQASERKKTCACSNLHKAAKDWRFSRRHRGRVSEAACYQPAAPLRHRRRRNTLSLRSKSSTTAQWCCWFCRPADHLWIGRNLRKFLQSQRYRLDDNHPRKDSLLRTSTSAPQWVVLAHAPVHGFLGRSWVVPNGVIVGANRAGSPCDAIGQRLPS